MSGELVIPAQELPASIILYSRVTAATIDLADRMPADEMIYVLQVRMRELKATCPDQRAMADVEGHNVRA